MKDSFAADVFFVAIEFVESEEICFSNQISLQFLALTFKNAGFADVNCDIYKIAVSIHFTQIHSFESETKSTWKFNTLSCKHLKTTDLNKTENKKICLIVDF